MELFHKHRWLHNYFVLHHILRKIQKIKKSTSIIQLFAYLLKAYEFFNCLKGIKSYAFCIIKYTILKFQLEPLQTREYIFYESYLICLDQTSHLLFDKVVANISVVMN